MGFEFWYAYAENIENAAGFVSLLSGGGLILLFILRGTNQMDKDDWFYSMFIMIPLFFFTLSLTLIPSMEHIEKVQDRINHKPVTAVTEEKPNETILLDSCNYNVNGLCRR